MRLLRYIAYSFLTLVIIFGPLYGAGRILLPEWLKGQIVSVLPSGAKLSIGEMSTTTGLGILYKKVVFETKDSSQKLILDDLLIEPNLNLSEPAVVSVGRGLARNNGIALNFQDFNATVIMNGGLDSPLSILGKIKSIEGQTKELFSNIEFLIKGVTSLEKSMSATVGKVRVEFLTPKGVVSIVANDMSFEGDFNKDLKAEINSGDLELDLSKIGDANINRVLFSERTTFSFELTKEDNWVLPIEFTSLNAKTPTGKLASEVILRAKGRWEKSAQNCDIFGLLSERPDCGKMIDVTGIFLNLEEAGGQALFLGDGFCVTPNAGCPQRIETEIKTRQTAKIFSNIMMSGVINPLVGGVILGCLLSSPARDSSELDH